MMDLFVDADFRKKIVAKLKNERLRAEWKAYEKLSDGMKGKVTEPVLNRLDLLTDDGYLTECLESTYSLDFTKWITGGYHVGINIPQRDLEREAVEILQIVPHRKSLRFIRTHVLIMKTCVRYALVISYGRFQSISY